MARKVSSQDQPIRGTDHIYGSGQRSAIPRTIADSKLKDPNKITPVITPRAVQPKGQGGDPAQLVSTDKYYANQEGKTAAPKPFDMSKQTPQSGSARQAVAHPQSTHLVEIKTPDEIVDKMQEAIDAAINGVERVRVLLYDKRLVASCRNRIDFDVTR